MAGGTDLSTFLGELIGIAASFGRYRLRLLFCDAEIQGEQIITEQIPFDPAPLRFKGFGGTSFTPVFEYLDDQPEPPNALIFCTDGYGPAPEAPPCYPVLWVLTADGRKPAREEKCLWLEPHAILESE